MAKLYWLVSSLNVSRTSLTFTVGGPSYKLRFKAKSTHIEKAKEALMCNIQDQLVMTIFVLISKSQPYPT